MELFWKKNKSEITTEDIEKAGGHNKVKIRKGKSSHNKAEKLIQDNKKLNKYNDNE